MNILFMGDVAGEAGLQGLEKALPELRRTYNADLTLVNGENASGVGMTPAQADRIFYAGADVITLGNHAFDRREILDRIDRDERILRPANLPRLPGRGSGIFEAKHRNVGVLVLSGRFGMDYSPDNPFLTVDKELCELKKSCSTVLVDFHAESTSEKIAMRYALEGKASLLVGTHTHVQTADEQIRGGTGYITDLGMCGPENSVIGVDPAWALEQFRNGKAFSGKTWPEGDAVIAGVFCEIGDNDGKCVRIERILKNVKL